MKLLNRPIDYDILSYTAGSSHDCSDDWYYILWFDAVRLILYNLLSEFYATDAATSAGC